MAVSPVVSFESTDQVHILHCLPGCALHHIVNGMQRMSFFLGLSKCREMWQLFDTSSHF